jgi:two-component system sensor histidine kinase UhpB
MVTAATVAAALLGGLDEGNTRWFIPLVAIALALTVTLNVALLARRFNPLEELIGEMEKVDLSQPGANLPPQIDGVGGTEEVERLEVAFLRMMRRLEAERRRSSSAALRAQEEERARVARDLHDQVNQSLTGVLLRLEAARAAAPPELRAEIDETSTLAHQAMDELLTVARQLRPTALDDLGLKAAIAGQVDQLEGGGVEIAFTSTDALGDLDPDTQLVIYRVSQEAIGNAIRHSGARKIEVNLSRTRGGVTAGTGDEVTLEVRDDGSGFTFEQADGGLGLGGMRERALLVGGELETESRPGSGTTIRLRVPARPRGTGADLGASP